MGYDQQEEDPLELRFVPMVVKVATWYDADTSVRQTLFSAGPSHAAHAGLSEDPGCRYPDAAASRTWPCHDGEDLLFSKLNCGWSGPRR
jgi:hypothetical protein